MRYDVQLIGTDGNPVTMKTINYFGFNNGATMFDGLWAGGDALTQDFGLNLYRIQVLSLALSRKGAQNLEDCHSACYDQY